MATIRKRGLRYQAIIRRTEHAPISRTFANRADAQQWARGIEREMDLGVFRTNQGMPADILLKDLLARYVSEITPHKKGRVQEEYRNRGKRPGASGWLGRLSDDCREMRDCFRGIDGEPVAEIVPEADAELVAGL